MKKNYLFYALLTTMVVLGLLPAQAETVTPYTESFNNLVLDPPEDFKPSRWDRIVDSWLSYGTVEYVTYENPATGGANDGAFLKAGSQEYFGPDWTWVDTHDILITPALTGEVSFYLLKTESYNSPNVKIYNYIPNGTGYTQGNLLKEYSSEISEEWQQFSLTVDPGTHLGFRLEYVGIDELQAASAEIVLKNSIKISSATLTSESKVIASEENRFKVSFDFTVTNNGDFDLTGNEEGYSVSIINQSAGGEVLATKTLDFPLAKGKTSTTLSIEASVDAGMEQRDITFALQENLRGSMSGSTSVNVLPYTPRLDLYLPDKTDTVSKIIDFGIVPVKASQSLRIVNKGGAPLNITNIALPEGYSVDVTTPLTVDVQSEKTFILSLTATTPGEKTGNITFTADVVGEKSYPIVGIVPETDKWLENFESGDIPGNMIFEENWKIADSPAGLGAAGNTAWAENSNVGAQTKIITPLLSAEEGEALTFFAARQDYRTTLKVYYSSDRTDWQLVKTIQGYNDGENEFTNDTDPDVIGTAYNTYAFKRFTLNNIPAGQWYIAFESGNARIDDIYGFQLAEVEHDWYPTATHLPGKGTVNHPYQASFTLTNMNSKAEAAGTYTATLYFNGEAVATAETSEWAASESKTFDFAYTPHEAGEYTAYMELSTKDYSIKSAETTVTVNKEMAVNEVIVGNADNTGNGVFNLTYNNSGSETIYTKNRLGLGNQADITSLAFLGYAGSAVEDVHITVWMENTDEDKFSNTTPRPTNEMTLVYDGTLRIDAQGSESDYQPIIQLPLSETFVYTGNHLRIATQASIPNWSYTVSFAIESNVPDQSINYQSDSESDRNKVQWNWGNSLPVIRLTTEKDVFTLSGKVSDEQGTALTNAIVTLASGDVLYQDTTDTDGNYNLEVFQSNLEYTLTVVKTGYKTISENLSFTDSSIVKNIVLSTDPTTGLDSLSNNILVLTGEGCIQLVSAVSGDVAVYSITGMLIEQRSITVGRHEWQLPAGSYIMKVNEKTQKVIVK